MRRELYLFAVLSVLTCVWPLGPDGDVGPYLHALFTFLILVPRANNWGSVHGWSRI